jgi:N-methylhydantoinase B/oxoprolinase/acetone carboxylase alpha subunit
MTFFQRWVWPAGGSGGIPGDVVATNDPWFGTGHLYDVNVMAPVFRDGRLVGRALPVPHHEAPRPRNRR